MKKIIKLENYFFDEDYCKVIPVPNGETKRSLNGTIHTDFTSKYYTIDLKISDLEKQEHELLLYILYLLYPDSGGTPVDYITLVDKLNNSYKVVIPQNSYKIDEDNEYFTWELTLEGTDLF